MIQRCVPALSLLFALTLSSVTRAEESSGPVEQVIAPTKAISIEVHPAEARPGDPVAIRVRGTTKAPTGTLGKARLRFFRYLDGHVAFTSLPIEAKLGVRPVKVKVPAHPPIEAELNVVAADWRTRQLKVSPAFTEKRSEELQTRIVADRKAFADAQSGELSAPRFKGSFALPREATFTAFFGDRRTFNGQVTSRHYGLDLEGAVGTPIHAANDGVVVLVRDAFFSGNSVIVDHGGGVFTLYFHLSAFDVSEGDRVTRGQLIGKVGSTGRVTGPHLHWSVKIDNRYVDPQRLIELALD